MDLEIIKRLPVKQSELPSILFVHGAYHAAWCWAEYFMPYFSERNFPCYAVSLRSHGGSNKVRDINKVTMDDYVDDVISAINSIKGKIILTGHSIGGGIVQKVMAKKPDRLAAAVLISSMPPLGLIFDILHMFFTKNKEARMFARFGIDPAAKLPAYMFLSDKLPKEEFNKYISLMQPESVLVNKQSYWHILPRGLQTSLPVLVIGSDSDQFVSEKSVKKTAAFYNTTPIIFKNMSHDIMLDPQWSTAADAMSAFLLNIIKSPEESIN